MIRTIRRKRVLDATTNRIHDVTAYRCARAFDQAGHMRRFSVTLTLHSSLELISFV